MTSVGTTNTPTPVIAATPSGDGCSTGSPSIWRRARSTDSRTPRSATVQPLTRVPRRPSSAARSSAALLRAGVRFASFIPAAAADTVNQRLRERGVDLDVRKIKLEDLDQSVGTMSDLSVDVHNPQGNVRVFFE